MSKMTDFLGEGGEEDRVKKFKKLSKGKTKEEIRALEIKLLKPEPIPTNTKEAATKIAAKPLLSRTVKIVMPDSEHYEMLENHFPVSGYVEKSISNATLLCLLLEALESGRIVYDKKNKKIKFKNSRRNRTV